MTETTEILKGKELELLLTSLPMGYGIPTLTEKQISDALAKEDYVERASQSVQKIAASKNNQEPGSTEVVVGRYHIKLRKLIRSAVTSVFFLGLSTTVDGTTLTLGAGIEQGLEFLAAFAETLETLTPTEILLYDIIAEIAAKNYFPSINPLHPQGTEKDIQDAILARQLDKPLDFGDALISLVNRQAIRAEHGEPNNPIYRPVF
jgi:hypothetical protein